MAKPFKVKEQRANVGRSSDGKFIRIEQPTVEEVMEAAKSDGQDGVRLQRVPDRPVGSPTPNVESGDAVYSDSIPWPEAGRVNDAGQSPMKLKS
tara:strand:+ start:490 stop:771 length:282 start_codon:yes stop_codon:yes gene_type:complete